MSMLGKRLSLIDSREELDSLYVYRTSTHKDFFQILIGYVDTGLVHTYPEVLKDWYEKHKHEYTSLQMEVLEKGLIRQGVDCGFVTHDRQVETFVDVMNEVGANIFKAVHHESFHALSYFVQDLQEITHREIHEIGPLENYLQKQLTYHQGDIGREIAKKEEFGVQNGREAEDMRTMPKPKQKLKFAADGTVSAENQTEIEVRQYGKEIIFQEKLAASPYFLYAGGPMSDMFVGKYYYKDAILSYTSAQARDIRFGGENMVIADLLVQAGEYKKIYVRGMGDDDRYYDTTKQYEEVEEDLYVDEFTKQESGLAEISHLVSANQDLVFRASITGTVLVEGVSGSGKTNLIFHRIDYLLQEYPDRFTASRIVALSPSEMLAAYMKSALDMTEFTFKESIGIQLLSQCSTGMHLPPYEGKEATKKYPLQELWDDLDQYKSLVSKQIKYDIENFFPTLKQDIENLARDLLKQLKDTLQDLSHQRFVSSHQTSRCEGDIALLKGFLSLVEKSEGKCTSLTQVKERIGSWIETGLHTPQYNGYTDQPIYIGRYHDQKLFSQLEESIHALFDKQYQSTVRPRMSAGRIDGLKLVSHWKKNIKKDIDSYISTSRERETVLTYIAHCLHEDLGVGRIYSDYQYVLVDEFQDFTPLQLAVIYRLYGSGMILSGDFMQSVYYEDLAAITGLGINLSDHKQLTDNFRNTLETVQFAHSIFGDQASEMFLAKRVVKRGKKPLEVRREDIPGLVAELVDGGSSSLCLIYQDIDEAQKIYDALGYEDDDLVCVFPGGFDTHRKAILETYYSHKIHFISYREAKGLEFDHVILLDSKNMLESDIIHKERLRYIAATRAVKQLRVRR